MSASQLEKKSQGWSALFDEPMSALVQRYTASVFFDRRMAQVDITGSLAHAKMLAAQGIISAQDLADIERGMAQIRAEIEAGSFDWKLELEDVCGRPVEMRADPAARSWATARARERYAAGRVVPSQRPDTRVD